MTYRFLENITTFMFALANEERMGKTRRFCRALTKAAFSERNRTSRPQFILRQTVNHQTVQDSTQLLGVILIGALRAFFPNRQASAIADRSLGDKLSLRWLSESLASSFLLAYFQCAEDGSPRSLSRAVGWKILRCPYRYCSFSNFS